MNRKPNTGSKVCAVCQHPLDHAHVPECPACGTSTAFTRLWETLPPLLWSAPAPPADIVWKQSLRLCLIEAVPEKRSSRAS